MTKNICNNCGTKQDARVFESSIPYIALSNPEISRFFILVIDKCCKCGLKRIQPVALMHSGEFVRFQFLKKKYFDKALKGVIKEVYRLPMVEKTNGRCGFYLNCNVYGVKTRCYENLSTLKLGLHLLGKDLDYDEKLVSRI